MTRILARSATSAFIVAEQFNGHRTADGSCAKGQAQTINRPSSETSLLRALDKMQVLRVVTDLIESRRC